MKHENIPIGGLDLDTDLHYIAPTDYVDARNTRNGYGSTIGAIEPSGGNQEFSVALSPGVNETVLALEDKHSNSVVYFVHNSLGNHTIYRYYPNESRVERLWQSSVLNLLGDIIHSAKIVNDKFLYWVDGTSSSSGNEPRKLNLDKLSIYLKKLSYTLYFGSTSFDIGSVFNIQIKENGVITTPTQVLYTVPGGPPSINSILSSIKASLIPFNISADLYFTGDGQSLVITHDQVGFTIDITATLPNIVHFSPLNHYDIQGINPTLLEEQFSVIKPVPACPPEPRYVVDTAVTENKVFNYSFQFRYQYVFDDGEVSSWGSSSYVPTNFGPIITGINTLNVTNDERFSKITIGFNDAILDDQQWKGIVTGINVAVKLEQDDIWRLVGHYRNEELGVDIHEIDFFNDKSYPAIPSDDGSAEDVQALKNFSFVPRNAMTMESISDDRGNYMLSLGGTVENYDSPEVKATLSIINTGHPSSAYPADQSQINKALKNGGTYRVGVIYADIYGRQCSVVKLGRVKVPFSQIGENLHYLRVEFESDPPSWAHSYRIVISENQNQLFYVQAPAWDVLYWVWDGELDEVKSTTYAAGDATFISFQFIVNDLDDNIRNHLFKESIDNDKFFIPEPLDRLQILNWNLHTLPVPGDIEKYNYKITGYSATYPTTLGGSPIVPNTFYVFIDFDPLIQPDFRGATSGGPDDYYVVELYRPGNETSENIYYEFGPCFIISGGTHGATVNLEGWGETYDTYKVYRHDLNGGGPYTENIQLIQRPYLHEVTNFIMGDLGRPVVYDIDLKEDFFRTRIRSSDVYRPNSSFNGLNSFRGTNYITLNNEFGILRKLSKVTNVLLAICEFKTQPIYLGKDKMLQLDGNSFVGRSNQLFNLGNELQHDLGTRNPESVVNEDGRLYCLDTYKGVVWRYTTGSGQIPISEEGLRNYFLEIGKANTTSTPGGFQREFATYYLNIGKQSLGFQEKNQEGNQKNKWCSWYDFAGEMFGWVGLHFMTFNAAKLWINEEGTICNYYGTQSNSSVSVVVNNDPNEVKMFMNIIQESSALWSAELITTIPTASYPDGMESQLISNKWGLYEGQYRADFMRDRKDPSDEFSAITPNATKWANAITRGRFLRGEVAIIKLKLEDSTISSKLVKIITTSKK